MKRGDRDVSVRELDAVERSCVVVVSTHKRPPASMMKNNRNETSASVAGR